MLIARMFTEVGYSPPSWYVSAMQLYTDATFCILPPQIIKGKTHYYIGALYDGYILYF